MSPRRKPVRRYLVLAIDSGRCSVHVATSAGRTLCGLNVHGSTPLPPGSSRASCGVCIRLDRYPQSSR